LTLGEGGWRWQGKIELRPIRTEAAVLDLEVPANWTDVRAASADIVESIVPIGGFGLRRVIRLVFAEPRRRPTTVVLDGVPPASASSDQASLVLPRALGTTDRGGQMTVNVPA